MSDNSGITHESNSNDKLSSTGVDHQQQHYSAASACKNNDGGIGAQCVYSKFFSFYRTSDFNSWVK